MVIKTKSTGAKQIFFRQIQFRRKKWTYKNLSNWTPLPICDLYAIIYYEAEQVQCSTLLTCTYICMNVLGTTLAPTHTQFYTLCTLHRMYIMRSVMRPSVCYIYYYKTINHLNSHFQLFTRNINMCIVVTYIKYFA